MRKIVTMGEILIDLTQTGVTEQGIPRFAANPGGAPANAAVAAARLGAKAGFIGCVGKDAFGAFLRKTLENAGVDTTGLRETEAAPTTLAVVSVDGRGERSFQFYRKPGADVCLDRAMVDTALLEEAGVFHFGSVSLTAQPSRGATLWAAGYAREQGALITYDPNYRAGLWPDEKTAVAVMQAPLPLVDVLKISDEETRLLSPYAQPEAAAAWLEDWGIPLVLVTLGEKGVLYRFRGKTGRVPGFPVRVADTNGAGDTFFGAVLSRLAEENLETLEEGALVEMLRMANCAAAITTSRPGAIPAMPTRQEVMERLEKEGMA